MKRVINIQPGAAGEPDCASANPGATASQMFTADLARLIEAIKDTALPDAEKEDAKEKLSAFLCTKAAEAILRDHVPHLLELVNS